MNVIACIYLFLFIGFLCSGFMVDFMERLGKKMMPIATSFFIFSLMHACFLLLITFYLVRTNNRELYTECALLVFQYLKGFPFGKEALEFILDLCVQLSKMEGEIDEKGYEQFKNEFLQLFLLKECPFCGINKTQLLFLLISALSLLFIMILGLVHFSHYFHSKFKNNSIISKRNSKIKKTKKV